MMPSVVMFVTNDAVSDPRVNKEAAALSEAGYTVTVLAWDRAGQAPVVEQCGPVRYERIGPRASYGGGIRSIGLFRRFWRLASQRALELQPDVVHCHDLDTAPAGMRVLRLAGDSRPRLVLDMHELYRDSRMVPQRGAAGFAARTAVRRLERRVFAASEKILVANPGTIDYYDKLGFAHKVALVENAPDAGLFRPHERPIDRPFTVGYFGQKRYPDGLSLLMDVVQADPSMRAILAGGGTAEQVISERARNLDHVTVSGRFTYDMLPGLYAQCDVVYAVYDVVLGNVRTLFPVKVMEAMACGLPVVVASGTWIGDYVAEHGIGLAVSSGDPGRLAEALTSLANNPELCRKMGEKGLRIVEDGLNWQSVTVKLRATYADVLSEMANPDGGAEVGVRDLE
ncbi:MAG: glycosyltransferase family 4 protein [Coriobacteriia bacterium]|nr:glycosyltransferase family 4 protein [Coriobacteriia bacterium]MBN2823368.1 glycosyltransferase family 4 protein [Coriobacteriia bacterium]